METEYQIITNHLREEVERRNHQRILDGIFYFALGGIFAIGWGAFLWLL